MFVRSTRLLGFQVGHQHIIVRPGIAPIQVPDEMKNAAGFDLCVKHGDLVVIEFPVEQKQDAQPETVQPEDAQSAAPKTKKQQKQDAQPETASASE